MDQLAAMTAFVRVADARSFSEAARRLVTSKSAVSRQIAALEAELGARLFHRTTRSLALTEAGQGYYDKVARILADIDEANASVSRLQAAPRGRLRINAPMSFGIRHLAPAIPDYLALYPEVEVDIIMNDRFVDLVDEGFDVAVRIGRMVDSSLVARRLAPMRRAVCASPAYLAAHGIPQPPDDLAVHACLGYSNMAPSDEWSFVAPDGRAWPVEVNGRMRVNNGDALRIAALKGLGLAFLPTFIVGADLQAGTLVGVLNQYRPPDGAMHAVYPHARHLSPKVRSFVDFLAERFGPRPYWDLVE
jgi:DNA-binding transcriptional LysR family regulator